MISPEETHRLSQAHLKDLNGWLMDGTHDGPAGVDSVANLHTNDE